MFGKPAGLYTAAMLVPGMNKVREPIQGWFIVALGLAMLAAGGLDWAMRRWQVRYLAAVVLAGLFVDVWYWNCYVNPLAYARVPFENVYGAQENELRTNVAALVPPLTRYHGLRQRIGPLDDTLTIHLESTTGYAALQISPYRRYLRLMRRNPGLRDGLNIGAYVTGDPPVLTLNPSVLPRAYFPKSIVDVKDKAELREVMQTLDPHERSVAFGPHEPIQQDPTASASIAAYDEQSYRVLYHAASPSLLRLSVPFFRGWRAHLNGKELPIVSIDMALMGVVVPAGDGEVQVDFASPSLRMGAAISIAGVLACGLLIWISRKRLNLNAAAPPS